MSLTATIRPHHNRPVLHMNGRPHTGMMWFGRPNAAADFARCGIHECTFILSATEAWWVGPGRYDFQSLDRLVDAFVRVDPRIRLMPRIHLGYQDLSWWALRHPHELSAGRDVNGRPADYFAVAANDIGCPFSFASSTFLHDASAALQALVQHCEQRDGGDRFFGYHVAGGISNEWFEWWTYVNGHAADYSAPAISAFRDWLRRRYRNSVAALRAAWRQPQVNFASAMVPPPRLLGMPRTGTGNERPIVQRQRTDMLRALRNPTREQAAIDYYDFLGSAAARLIGGLCRAVKRACHGRKLAGVFHGYAYPHWNNLSAARQAHSGFRQVLTSPHVDFIAAPYHYDNRGLHGVHESQSLPAAISAAGKLFVDEIDTFTHLTRWPWNSLRTVRHARTPVESEAVLMRDAARVQAHGGGAWWMDLLHQRWHGHPRIVRTLQRARQQCRRTLERPLRAARVAVFVDERASLYWRPGSDLVYHLLTAQRQFELADLQVSFDELLLSDIRRRGLPDYRLCLFPNACYMDERTRTAALRYTRHAGRCAVWFHAPGVFGVPPTSATQRLVHGMNLHAASQVIGMPLLADARPGRLRVRLTGAVVEHGLMPSVPVADTYGMPLSPERERQTVVHPHPLGWQDATAPIFHVKPHADVVALGTLVGSDRIALAMRRWPDAITIYSAAPCLPASLLRGLAL